MVECGGWVVACLLLWCCCIAVGVVVLLLVLFMLMLLPLVRNVSSSHQPAMPVSTVHDYSRHSIGTTYFWSRVAPNHLVSREISTRRRFNSWTCQIRVSNVLKPLWMVFLWGTWHVCIGRRASIVNMTTRLQAVRYGVRMPVAARSVLFSRNF